MSNVKRSEIIYLYDLSWANPNGDPNDGNKPRIDTETGINIVTDVRLKRTIRDELEKQGYEILIKDTYNETTGSLNDAKARAKDFLDGNKNMENLTKEEIKQLYDNVKRCIDVKLFGCTLPYAKNKNSVTYTGPVQFKMGYSMLPVKMEFIKGTGAFASSENKEQRTFRQEYLLAYSLINFYGIVNNRLSEKTGLEEKDINVMLDAMWNGTKNLISRSKAGQKPRLLIKVNYIGDDYYIGSIDKLIKFDIKDKLPESIRDIKEGTIILSELKDRLIDKKDLIDSVIIKKDNDVITDIDIIQQLSKAGIKVIEEK